MIAISVVHPFRALLPRTLFLAFVLLAVNGVPIPVGEIRNARYNSHGDAQRHQRGPWNLPVSHHEIPCTEHTLGLVKLTRTSQTLPDLRFRDAHHKDVDVFAKHAYQALGKEKHVVNLQHIRGHEYAHFHAIANTRDHPHGVAHVIHPPGRAFIGPLVQHNPPTTKKDDVEALDHSLHASDAADPPHYIPAHPGVHGRGIIGRLPVSHFVDPKRVRPDRPNPGLKEHLDEKHLNNYAQWIRNRYGGEHQQDLLVHVAQRYDDTHVHFLAAPTSSAHGIVLRPPGFTKALSPEESAKINNHLRVYSRPQSFERATRHGSEGYSFSGKIKAHTTGQMTPAMLDEYAKHARQSLINLHGAGALRSDGFTIAAVHKPGDEYVHYASAPRGSHLQAFVDKTVGHPQFTSALQRAGHFQRVTQEQAERQGSPYKLDRHKQGVPGPQRADKLCYL